VIWEAAAAFVHVALLLLGLPRRANPLRPAMKLHRAVVLLLLSRGLQGWTRSGTRI
jgi:hypothetical protein